MGIYQKIMSFIINKYSVFLHKRQILNGIDLEIAKKTINVLMGPNGSGKSTLALGLMGFLQTPYKITNSAYLLDNCNMNSLSIDQRARKGLFLAFQNPIAIPGVSVADLLRSAYLAINNKTYNLPKIQTHNPVLNVWQFNKLLVDKANGLGISQELLGRSINDNFSGGEKKKIELLQAMILQPKYLILDEIDAGLDIDAVKIIAKNISSLKEKGCGILLITHYQRILRHLKPDSVRVMINGKIVAYGGYGLAKEVEKSGYGKWNG